MGAYLILLSKSMGLLFEVFLQLVGYKTLDLS